ncbi:MAG: ABC transporter permease subunit [Clostridia bacterium]|nr:ABC transporter permease subunit [Clostridia bacterium]
MIRSRLVKIWAYASFILIAAIVVFLFAFVFIKGAGTISWTFLTDIPRGAVLGSEGGILPAIAGSFLFTATAAVLGGIPAITSALYMVFFCKSKNMGVLFKSLIQCIAGIPSIVLGLFAYSFLVKDLGLGRCVLSGGTALAVMILPFIEVRAEKAFSEMKEQVIHSSYALGCSKTYTIFKLVLPSCRGELVSAIILGCCYAMGATAPLIFTGGVAFSAVPDSLAKPAMALPLHLYLLIAQGTTSLPTAYGTAFVMMAILLISNMAATLYAARVRKK